MRNDSGFTSFVLAAIVTIGLIATKVIISGDARCLVTECVVIKQ